MGKERKQKKRQNASKVRRPRKKETVNKDPLLSEYKGKKKDKCGIIRLVIQGRKEYRG